jgi:hypothetical protein
MLTIGIDVFILLIIAIVIGEGTLLVARRCLRLDEESSYTLSVVSLVTSGILIASYVVMCIVLDSLC